MYLSYSGWKKSDCNFAYWHGYINKTKLPGPDDRLGSIYGSVVGKLFEVFYNEELYRKPQPAGELLSRVDATIQEIIHDETSAGGWKTAGVLMWKGKEPGQNPKALYANVEELAADVRDAIDHGFRTIRQERLLGRGAQAEVKLDATIGGHRIGGRADFVMRRVQPHNDEVIIDGKGSKWREAFVDHRQLKWYAMLFRHHHGRLPDRLGFLYWRFDPPESLDWVEFTSKEIDEFQARVLGDIARIEELAKGLTTPTTFEAARKVFLPLAGSGADIKEVEQACRFCPFATEEICPEGARVQQGIAERGPRKPKRSSGNSV